MTKEYPSNCVICGEPVALTTKAARSKARKRGYAYCLPPAVCSEVGRRANLSATKTGGRHTTETKVKMSIDAKIRYENPAERERTKAALANPATLARKSAAMVARFQDPAKRIWQSDNHKRLGIQPPRGHNYSGDKPTKHEALLLAALPSTWLLHHRIARGTAIWSSTARWVEIDLALPAARVAVEVDGRSHRLTAQKARDREKEMFLMSRVWRVIRVGNEEVRTALEGCVAFITRVASRPAAAQTARPF
jgi:very-short-patch-repair endonuclease